MEKKTLVSTYLCLQKLTPIKGFPKCLSIVSNLQRGPKIFMWASCGPNNSVASRGYKFRPACNSARDPSRAPILAHLRIKVARHWAK